MGASANNNYEFMWCDKCGFRVGSNLGEEYQLKYFDVIDGKHLCHRCSPVERVMKLGFRYTGKASVSVVGSK